MRALSRRARPKSNAVYIAYGAARAFVAEDGSRPVPLHLRNAPTEADEGAWATARATATPMTRPMRYAAGERYLPDGMPDVMFYEPTERGLEAKIRERLQGLRKRDQAAGGKRGATEDE